MPDQFATAEKNRSQPEHRQHQRQLHLFGDCLSPGNANWALKAAAWPPLQSSIQVRLVSSTQQIKAIFQHRHQTTPHHASNQLTAKPAPRIDPRRGFGLSPAGWADLPRRSGRRPPAHRLSTIVNMRRKPQPIHKDNRSLRSHHSPSQPHF